MNKHTFRERLKVKSRDRIFRRKSSETIQLQEECDWEKDKQKSMRRNREEKKLLQKLGRKKKKSETKRKWKEIWRRDFTNRIPLIRVINT